MRTFRRNDDTGHVVRVELYGTEKNGPAVRVGSVKIASAVRDVLDAVAHLLGRLHVEASAYVPLALGFDTEHANACQPSLTCDTAVRIRMPKHVKVRPDRLVVIPINRAAERPLAEVHTHCLFAGQRDGRDGQIHDGPALLHRQMEDEDLLRAGTRQPGTHLKAERAGIVVLEGKDITYFPAARGQRTRWEDAEGSSARVPLGESGDVRGGRGIRFTGGTDERVS